MIGRLYDETGRTNDVNVIESVIIDGGLIGSKSKFVNQTKPRTGENCGSRLVRVRCDAYVTLFCKRSVEQPGEFLFDNRFMGEVLQRATRIGTRKSNKVLCESDKTSISLSSTSYGDAVVGLILIYMSEETSVFRQYMF